MPRPRINAEAIPGRFPKGTKARLRRVRRNNETQADQIRTAVLHLLRTRERGSVRHRLAK